MLMTGMMRGRVAAPDGLRRLRRISWSVGDMIPPPRDCSWLLRRMSGALGQEGSSSCLAERNPPASAGGRSLAADG
jgi:hypothetical protein